MDFQNIYDQAHKAGMNAVVSTKVEPMLVGQETKLFSGQIDYSKPVYIVEDGVCGFAWINIKPGNSPFANWLKKSNLAQKDHYYGGVTIWVSDFNQSYERKMAYASAFASKLRELGIDKAYSNGRLD